MIILHLSCCGFPQEEDISLDMEAGAVFLPKQDANRVSFAIEAVTTGQNLTAMPPGAVITAEVKTQDGVYFVVAEQGGLHANLGLDDATGMYCSLISHREQEAKRLILSQRNDGFTDCFRRYSENPEELVGSDVGSKPFFVGQLHRYLGRYRPRYLWGEKNLSVRLDAAGVFYASSPYEKVPWKQLDDWERRRFRFYCFMECQLFWKEYRMMQNIHTELRPLIIEGMIKGQMPDLYARELQSIVRESERQCVFLC